MHAYLPGFKHVSPPVYLHLAPGSTHGLRRDDGRRKSAQVSNQYYSKACIEGGVGRSEGQNAKRGVKSWCVSVRDGRVSLFDSNTVLWGF